ncbi:hypothetical protein IG631_16780 [Alternaria alternata]|nr:hypothetical protein IG631_16780 [Alternaria alternata]
MHQCSTWPKFEYIDSARVHLLIPRGGERQSNESVSSQGRFFMRQSLARRRNVCAAWMSRHSRMIHGWLDQLTMAVTEDPPNNSNKTTSHEDGVTTGAAAKDCRSLDRPSSVRAGENECRSTILVSRSG